jgi:glyoxylase-like metal-dependent hydrolase (beta-lactamase superfamily II)
VAFSHLHFDHAGNANRCQLHRGARSHPGPWR